MARGFIRGTHHLTFCVGGAQEDYDFHVRLLGLKSVKKTVLFDGEIPIYHLYYGNGAGDASTILTAFPYRQAGWMGKRGTNQAKSLNLAVPADSIGANFERARLVDGSCEDRRSRYFFNRHRLPRNPRLVHEGTAASYGPIDRNRAAGAHQCRLRVRGQAGDVDLIDAPPRAEGGRARGSDEEHGERRRRRDDRRLESAVPTR